MPGPTLDAVDAQARRLSREEQLELARRLLERADGSAEPRKQYKMTDFIGTGNGTWRTAEDVEEYIRQERDSWDR